MNIERYVEIAVTGVFTIVLFIYGLKKKFQSSNITWTKTFVGSVHIDERLLKFVEDGDIIEMVTLVVAENGGGIPHPGSRIKTSIIGEGRTRQIPSYREQWQNVPVDTYYMTFLRECSIAGFCIVEDTSKLENSTIKDAALSIGVTSFRLEYVTSSKKAWYYIVESTTNGVIPTDAKTNDNLRVLKSDLKQLINS